MTHSEYLEFYQNANIDLRTLEDDLEKYTPSPAHPHDAYIKICIEEAISAVKDGNYGVGSCLVKAGEVVMRGHNQVIFPHFRSDLHGEMTVMTAFEDQYKNASDMHTYTLFTSLEPCPMCTVRLITAGVGQVYWATPDPESGMMATMERMTPVWAEMAKRQQFADALCSPVLGEMARQVWLASANRIQNKVRLRRRGAG